MLNLLIGFILGVAVSWFWQTQFNGVPAFRKLMQKELAVNGQLGSITVLKKKLEQVETRLAEMEKGSTSVEEVSTAGEFDQAQKPVEALSLVRAAEGRPAKAGRGRARGRVMALWGEGCTPADIAAKTGLGQGEVDLIISIGGRAAEGSARKERPEKSFADK